MKPQLPLRQELENASSTFEKYKSKISSFFINTKKLEDLSKKLSSQQTELTGLNKLVPDYDDDDDDEENEKADEKKSHYQHNKNSDVIAVGTIDKSDMNTNQVAIAPSQNETRQQQQDEESDDEDEEVDDSCETDLERQCDLEIMTTSEIKSNMYGSRNYLIPSLKASLFPLKATRDYSCVTIVDKTLSVNDLIAFEKSNGGLTFMGRSGSILSNQQANNNTYTGDNSKLNRSSLAQILFSGGRR